MKLKDGHRHKGLRKRLIESISRKGITDKKVLDAMMRVPRHFFMDNAFLELSYEDKAFPIGNEQTISQPFTVAYQTMLLQLEKREKVLEIGTGSGYQAAILAEMGARVFTVERQESLYHKTRLLLDEMGYQGIRTFFRDGMKGLGEFAPFDKIIVTAGAIEIPEALLDQLKIGGCLVIPLGQGDSQIMKRVWKLLDKKYKTEVFDAFRFVPLLSGIERKEN